jgi:hypothetical protein
VRTRPRELLQAVGLLAVLLAVFLWKPLTSGGAYAPTDLLQSSPLLRTAPEGQGYGNLVLTDPVQQMLPWFDWNRAELRSGRLPVWNPYNGNGVPHLANDQTAAVSPFGLPFLMLPLRAALVAAAALRLLAFGLFTYLYLRVIRLSHLAALVGMVAFTFGAYNLLWLQWPQPAPAVCLPAALWAAELAVRAGPDRRRAGLAAVAFGGAVAVGLLASHPETLFFSLGLVLVYVPLRLAVDRARPAAQRLRTGGLLALGGALGLGLAGVQLLPFLEYLHRSTAYAQSANRALLHYDPRFAAFHAFPNLFGNPSTAYYDSGLFKGSIRLGNLAVGANYNEAVSYYIGLGVLLLAGIGVVAELRRGRRRFPLLFLAAAAAIWLVYVNDLGGLAHLAAALPVVNLSAVNRSHPIWLFAASCLAAAGVDALASCTRRVRVASGVVAAGSGLLAVALVAAWALHRRGLGEPGSLAGTAVARQAVRHHVAFVVLTFEVVLLAGAALALWGGRRWARNAAVAALVAGVFAQSGFLLRGYNPTVDPGYLPPQSAAMAALTKEAGTEQVWLDDLLFPDVNLWYRVRVPGSYDGLGVREHDALLGALAASPASLLRATGVRYVATSRAYPMAVTTNSVRLEQPLAADRPLTARFVVPAAGLSGVRVLASGDGCRVDVELADVAADKPVAHASAPSCRQPGTALSLPVQPLSAGREYQVSLTGAGRVDSVEAFVGGAPGLEQLEGSGPVSLFRVPDSPGRYLSPAVALRAGTEAQALAAVSQAAFDAGRTVLIQGETPGPPAGGVGTVKVLEESATRIRLQVQREGPGWLVALQTWYPGWKATVDGRPVSVRRADVAFSAVPVGGGTSTVELRYQPRSVRWGLALTAASAVGLDALALWALGVGPRRRRHRRHRRGGGRRPEQLGHEVGQGVGVDG